MMCLVLGSVNVAWIDDQSAYVGLQKPEQLKVALKTLSQSDTYKIMTYSKREAMLNNNVTTEKRTTSMKVYSNNNKINKFKRPLRESDDAILKRRIVSITALVLFICLCINFYHPLNQLKN